MKASELIKVLEQFVHQGLDLPVKYEDDGRPEEVGRVVPDTRDQEQILWLV